MTTFFTAVDSNFIPPAMVLFRSLKKYFPDGKFIVLGYNLSTKEIRYFSEHNIEHLEIHDEGWFPGDKKRTILFSRFFMEHVPGDYLVYLDADTCLYKKVDALFEVPNGKLGFMREDQYGYTVQGQMRKELDSKPFFEKHKINPEAYAYNTGVISGAKTSWLNFLQYLRTFVKNNPEILKLTALNQGCLNSCLYTSDFAYKMPDSCNMFDEFWDQESPAILHFEGWPRPWQHDRDRPDNTVKAFAHWRSFSKLKDFKFTHSYWNELLWSCLDEMRPRYRSLKSIVKKA